MKSRNKLSNGLQQNNNSKSSSHCYVDKILIWSIFWPNPIYTRLLLNTMQLAFEWIWNVNLILYEQWNGVDMIQNKLKEITQIMWW